MMKRDVVAVSDDEIEPAAQDVRALFRQCLRPGAEGALRRFDRADGLGFAKARSFSRGRRRSRGWRSTRSLSHPFSVDKALTFEERGDPRVSGRSLRGWRLYSKRAGDGEAVYRTRFRINETPPAIKAKTASMMRPPATASTK